MKFHALFRSAAATVLLATAASAQVPADFDRLIGSGYSELRAAAQAAPAPAAGTPAVAAAVPGGAFLHSSADGRIAYCSASGCRVLLNAGAGVVLPAAEGSLYFSGPEGTGHCTIDACAVLLPGVRATFPLEAAPNGAVYASSNGASWYCTTTACARAGDQPLEKGSNYIGGVYKRNGDFVASGSEGTFWCSSGRCARVGAERLLFVDEGCAGKSPAGAVYGFEGNEVYRCTPNSCAKSGSADGIDNFVDCAFDRKGDLLLNARDGNGGFVCSEAGVVRSSRSPVAKRVYPAVMARNTDSSLRAADGATYAIDDRNRDPRSAGNGSDSLSGGVTRVVGARETALSFDTKVTCWRWEKSGDDDDSDADWAWFNDCRLVR